MLPFLRLQHGRLLQHWLSRRRFSEETLPKIFYVNWFRKGADGRWLWPGFGENSRVLEWVFERVSGRGDAVDHTHWLRAHDHRDQPGRP
jgi:phosphoenolpyruvate carboxykinase (GTP)